MASEGVKQRIVATDVPLDAWKVHSRSMSLQQGHIRGNHSIRLTAIHDEDEDSARQRRVGWLLLSTVSMHSCRTVLRDYDRPSIYLCTRLPIHNIKALSKQNVLNMYNNRGPYLSRTMKTAYCTMSGGCMRVRALQLGGPRAPRGAFTIARSRRVGALGGRRGLAGSPALHGSRTPRPSGASAVRTPSAVSRMASRRRNARDSRRFCSPCRLRSSQAPAARISQQPIQGGTSCGELTAACSKGCWS